MTLDSTRSRVSNDDSHSSSTRTKTKPIDKSSPTRVKTKRDNSPPPIQAKTKRAPTSDSPPSDPRSREAKTLGYLKRLNSLQASPHDVARALDLAAPWGAAQAVATLEKLVREKMVKKMKSGGETRYLAR